MSGTSNHRGDASPVDLMQLFEQMMLNWEQYVTMDANTMHRHEIENAVHFRYNEIAMATIEDRELEVWRIVDQMMPEFSSRHQELNDCLLV